MYYAIVQHNEAAQIVTNVLLFMYGVLSIGLLDDNVKRKIYKQGPPTNRWVWLGIESAIAISLVMGSMYFYGIMYAVIVLALVMIYDDLVIGE
jgi:hypothetical protein